MSTTKPHGLIGKPSNNTKAPEDKAESFIHARCKTSDKAAWVKAAQAKKLKLAEWVNAVLNDAAKKW
jgi:predicted HicB family RNase H-like nuclease